LAHFTRRNFDAATDTPFAILALHPTGSNRFKTLKDYISDPTPSNHSEAAWRWLAEMAGDKKAVEYGQDSRAKHRRLRHHGSEDRPRQGPVRRLEPDLIAEKPEWCRAPSSRKIC
jgi:hypothetical protein